MNEDNSQEIKTVEQLANSKPWQFKPGISGNPKGRPPGQSLKEYWRKKFAEMSDEEKEIFTKRVGNEMIWKMAEGNPHNDLDLTGEVISKIIKLDE